MKNSIDVSLPQSKMVRGYEIKRMPIGAYLQAMQTLNDTPRELIEALYPGEGVDGFLRKMRNMDKDALYALIMKASCVLPERVIGIFSQVSGIGADKLIGDPKLGLDGLMELVLAWAEVNGIENFTSGVRQLMEKIRALTGRTGSKG